MFGMILIAIGIIGLGICALEATYYAQRYERYANLLAKRVDFYLSLYEEIKTSNDA